MGKKSPEQEAMDKEAVAKYLKHNEVTVLEPAPDSILGDDRVELSPTDKIKNSRGEAQKTIIGKLGGFRKKVSTFNVYSVIDQAGCSHSVAITKRCKDQIKDDVTYSFNCVSSPVQIKGHAPWVVESVVRHASNLDI